MMNRERFAAPLEIPRPRNSHRLESYSPKLGRRLRLYSRAAFEYWLHLEADPDVLSLCERPARLALPEGERVVDFWVCRRNREEVVLLELDPDSLPNPIPKHVEFEVGLRACVVFVTAADLLSWRPWVLNWETMLPYLCASQGMVSDQFRSVVLKSLASSKQLSTLERELSPADPMLIRAALFGLLHDGAVVAPNLRERPLDGQTRFQAIRQAP